MTELVESISISLHQKGDEACPFCPGVKEQDWTTFKGEDNKSKKLREAMEDPTRCDFAQHTGARKKDGLEGRQDPDHKKEKPAPIFNLSEYGDYNDQAHHSISGKEIMEGHRIEKVITAGSLFTGDTGYNINNNANGVYLPAYPKKYKGTWGKKEKKDYPKTYKKYNGSPAKVVNNKEEDKAFKLEVMKPAMDAHGQAHIGNHKGHYIEELEGYNKTYPSVVKKELNAIIRRVIHKGKECPFCVESNGTQKKPFIPPYRVNQWLDNLSTSIKDDLKAPPASWKYFISEIAKDYTKGKKMKKSNKSKLTSKV